MTQPTGLTAFTIDMIRGLLPSDNAEVLAARYRIPADTIAGELRLWRGW